MLIKDSKSFEGRPQKESAKEGQTTQDGADGTDKHETNKTQGSRKIFVGNLGFQTTEDDLSAHFEKCGEIEWVKVATFEDSGKCKGYGWLKFKEAEAADWAVKGFVRIKEAVETEDDFKESTSDDEDANEAAKEKHFKMRKWWVNRLRGRELKIEAAEDDQVRYKKRYGKKALPREQVRRVPPKEAEMENARPGQAESAPSTGYRDVQIATYLTGGVVKSQGKKTTFD